MANVLMSWGPMKCLISQDQIIPFENFSTSVKLKEDSENDTSGTAPTNTRGKELQPMTFSITYMRAAGVDPRAKYDEWCALLGSAYPLLIGGTRFGPAKMLLTQADLSDCMLSNTGIFLKATVSITLKENAEEKTSIVSTSTPTASGSKISAFSATATGGDRALKKVTRVILE